MKNLNMWNIIIENTPKSGSENMAIDEFLFLRAHENSEGFFRIYYWDRPTFSIGVSQKCEKVLDLEYLEKNAFGFVRRITGGKVVLHDDEITYSVVSSEEKFYKDNDLYKSYELIAGIILNTLHLSGIDAYMSKGSSPHLSKSNDPCFSFPTPNEIEVDGKKIVGSAQKRNKHALLQHGSIPFNMNFEIYSGGSGFNRSLLKRNMTTVSENSSISKMEFASNFKKSFEEFLGTSFNEYFFSDSDLERIKSLESKYSSKEWNYLL